METGFSDERGSIRRRLVPNWCYDLWPKRDPGEPFVPAKFVQVNRYGSRSHHYGEAYSMAVLEGRVAPREWRSMDGGDGTPTWLRDGKLQAIYENSDG